MEEIKLQEAKLPFKYDENKYINVIVSLVKKNFNDYFIDYEYDDSNLNENEKELLVNEIKTFHKNIIEENFKKYFKKYFKMEEKTNE